MIDYETPVTTLSGDRADLSAHQGKVLLIVNTASRCGLTPQYADLEALYQEYRTQGLEVLGFPCDQFGHQEPGTDTEIASFCQINYGVTFPMHAKIDVNGDGAHPLFRQLKRAAPGALGPSGIKWNFTKFLVDRHGRVLQRYAPTTPPREIVHDIEAALAA